MTTLATVEDVESLYQPLTDQEALRVSRLLRIASGVLRTQVLGLDDRLVAGTLSVDLVTDVVASAVVRALRNPEGVKTQSIGPESVTFDDRVAAGRVYFTADELALVRPPRPVGSPVRSIRLTAGLA